VQKIASKGQGARIISSGRQQRAAPTDPVRAVTTGLAKVVSIDPAVEADPVIWIAKLRTGRVVTFRASGSRIFSVEVLIAPVAGVDLAVSAAIDSVAVEDSAVIASAAAVDLAAVALGDLADSAAVAGLEAGGNK
jgi:hypothetical protein